MLIPTLAVILYQPLDTQSFRLPVMQGALVFVAGMGVISFQRTRHSHGTEAPSVRARGFHLAGDLIVYRAALPVLAFALSFSPMLFGQDPEEQGRNQSLEMDAIEAEAESLLELDQGGEEFMRDVPPPPFTDPASIHDARVMREEIEESRKRPKELKDIPPKDFFRMMFILSAVTAAWFAFVWFIKTYVHREQRD